MSPAVIALDAPPALTGPFYLDADVRPNRSLSQSGFLIVMGVVIGVSFFAGLLFFSLGAWPVIGFFGLDILLVAWAFHANYKAGRRQGERVRVTGDAVHVEQRCARGRVSHFGVSPHFARVELQADDDGKGSVDLVAGGKRLALAVSLAPHERPGFAQALKAAIAKARAERFA
jgi:uncharacterized membrane protein